MEDLRVHSSTAPQHSCCRARMGSLSRTGRSGARPAKERARSQHVGMGRGLYEREASFRVALDACAEAGLPRATPRPLKPGQTDTLETYCL